MKEHVKTKFILIAAILSISFMGISYSLWDENMTMDMSVSTGHIELVFNNFESPDGYDANVLFPDETAAKIEATIQRNEYQPGSVIKLFVENTGNVPVSVKDEINDILIEPGELGEIKVPLAVDNILYSSPNADLGVQININSKLKYTVLNDDGWNGHLTVEQTIYIIEPEPLLPPVSKPEPEVMTKPEMNSAASTNTVESINAAANTAANTVHDSNPKENTNTNIDENTSTAADRADTETAPGSVTDINTDAGTGADEFVGMNSDTNTNMGTVTGTETDTGIDADSDTDASTDPSSAQ